MAKAAPHITCEGAFKDVYWQAMGANHCFTIHGHVGLDIIKAKVRGCCVERSTLLWTD